jgi:hypothetical protein
MLSSFGMLEEERFVVCRSTVLLLGHFLSKLQLASLIMHIHWMTKSLGWLWPWNLTILKRYDCAFSQER